MAEKVLQPGVEVMTEPARQRNGEDFAVADVLAEEVAAAMGTVAVHAVVADTVVADIVAAHIVAVGIAAVVHADQNHVQTRRLVVLLVGIVQGTENTGDVVLKLAPAGKARLAEAADAASLAADTEEHHKAWESNQDKRSPHPSAGVECQGKSASAAEKVRWAHHCFHAVAGEEVVPRARRQHAVAPMEHQKDLELERAYLAHCPY